MIEVPADIHYAFHQEHIARKLRVKWTISSGTQVVDITDRIIDIGEVNRQIGSYLGGFRISFLSLTLDNTDRFFSPHAAKDKSLLSYRAGADYLGGTITVEDAVFGAVTGWHYIPVYKGRVQTMDLIPGTVEIKVEDLLSLTMERPIPEDFVLDPKLTVGEQIRTLMTSFSPIVAGDIDVSGSFARNEAIQDDMDWRAFGTIRANTSLDRAISDLARSGFGMVYADENGKIVYETEFPRVSGDQERVIRQYPDLIDSSNASGFTMVRGAGLIATEVVVKYQGVAAHFPSRSAADTVAIEAKIGRTAVTVAMPYLFMYRNARQAARVLYEMGKDYMDGISFVTHGIGLVLQVNDRILVKDPINDVSRLYRIVSKTWSDTFIAITAVFEHHVATYIDETFGRIGTTSWTSSTARWW